MVGELGAVEAVAGEARGGAGQTDPGVLDPARPAVGGVEAHAGIESGRLVEKRWRR